jgi:hypothetical protein
VIKKKRRWLHSKSISAACVECANQFLPVGVVQGRNEVEDLIQDFVGLEVDTATGEVHVSTGSETSFFIEYNADTPAPTLDGLLATAALGLPARRSLGAVDTLEAFARCASECHPLEALSIRYALSGCRQRFKERLRALIRRAQRMKPQGCLALPKEIWNALTEAQISALDGLGAAAALGATGCGGFKQVGHAGRILGGR